jgi:hypothetical protein
MSQREEEIRYHIEVEPPLHAILNKIAEDADNGIAPFNRDELIRAVWIWADGKLHEYDFAALPQWFVNMVAEGQQRRAEANTIEGDAGEG